MSTNLENKNVVLQFFKNLNNADDAQCKNVLNTYLSEDITLNISHPFTEMRGVDSYYNNFWKPLTNAFPDFEIQPYICVGGDYENRSYVSSTGNIIGTFTKNWLDIPATNQPTWLRFSGHFIIENSIIKKAWFFFDFLDVMRQAGYNLFPNRGIEIVPPAPMTGDGIVTYFTTPEQGQESLKLTNNMLDGLGSYDGKTLDSMGQEHFWNEKDMMWYGPSGIGTTRGLKGFQKNHQVPFITAFPDRGITEKVDNDYFTQIGDGNYSCDFGFPAMYGTHLADGWLGLKTTKKRITLRVVDYWRREDNRLKENWVFIDMPHVLQQLGIDVFALLKEKINNNKL